MTYRIRFAFTDGAWRVSSVRRSNEFATVPVQSVERKRAGQAYLPVLSDREPHEFIAGCTPYACVHFYLAGLDERTKRERALAMRAAA